MSEGTITDGMFRLRGIETVKLDAVRELLLAADRWQSAVNSSFGLDSRQRAETELMRRIEHWRRVRDMEPTKAARLLRATMIPMRIVNKDPKNSRKKSRRKMPARKRR